MGARGGWSGRRKGRVLRAARAGQRLLRLNRGEVPEGLPHIVNGLIEASMAEFTGRASL
jgi:hypothetical protein